MRLSIVVSFLLLAVFQTFAVDVSVYHRSGNSSISGNLSMSVYLKVVNNDATPLPLNDYKLEYYFNDEPLNTSNITVPIDWCKINGDYNVQSQTSANVVEISPAYTANGKTANLGVVFSFNSGSVLEQNEYLELHARIHKSTWGYYFDESDDWSFQSLSTFTIAPNVVLRDVQTNNVVAGTFPSESATIPDEINDIIISNTEISEALSVGSTCATFTPIGSGTTEPTYTFESGVGGEDNSSFQISENELKLNSTLDASTKSTYKIKVKGTQGEATFIKAFVLSIVGTSGYTVVIDPALSNGSIQIDPVKSNYNLNETILVTATANSGYNFASWSGDISGTDNPVYVTVNSNMNISASFTSNQLSIITTNVGDGTISLNPSGGSYAPGTVVQVTATPNSGQEFTGWDGQASGTDNPLSITLDENMSISANFSAIEPPRGGGDARVITNYSTPDNYSAGDNLVVDGNIWGKKDLVLGANQDNQKYILHSRSDRDGDFFQLTYEDLGHSDGGWAWYDGLSLRRNNGNIGIGLTNPKEKLHVEGNIRLNGDGSMLVLKDNANASDKNTKINPKLYNEGIITGDGKEGGTDINGEPALGWGLHLNALAWKNWHQDPIYHHAGSHRFYTTKGADGIESLKMELDNNGKLRFNEFGYSLKKKAEINPDTIYLANNKQFSYTQLKMTSDKIKLSKDGRDNDYQSTEISSNGIATPTLSFNSGNDELALIAHKTSYSGTTDMGDGFRLNYNNNFDNVQDGYRDVLVFEKTDGNQLEPDGGVAFLNTGTDGINTKTETAMFIKGNGNVGIGTNNPSHSFEVYNNHGLPKQSPRKHSKYFNVNVDDNEHPSIEIGERDYGYQSNPDNNRSAKLSTENLSITRGWGDWFNLKTTKNTQWVVHNNQHENSLQFGFDNDASVGGDASMTWNVLKLQDNGSVGIGTTGTVTEGVKLEVAGPIKTTAVKIDDWTIETPDYVFQSDYKLRSLDDVEKHIKEKSHLPEVPSAADMKRDGVDLAEMNMILLKKVEELTLYTIEQEKKLTAVIKELNDLKEK